MTSEMLHSFDFCGCHILQRTSIHHLLEDLLHSLEVSALLNTFVFVPSLTSSAYMSPLEFAFGPAFASALCKPFNLNSPLDQAWREISLSACTSSASLLEVHHNDKELINSLVAL
jgi:hypothetical protein